MEDKFTAIVAADDLCPCLRGFDEGEALASVNGALALRPKIEGIVDQIWADGFDGIWFMGIGGTWASCLQAEVHMRGKSRLPVFAENAAEFLTTGNRRFTEKSVVVLSSVSGNTKEMVALVDRVHEIGGKVFSFIDTPGSILTQADKQDYLIVAEKNEQLKFFMVCNYLMYKNGEFPDYAAYNAEMEASLARDLVDVEILSDAWAFEYARKKAAEIQARPDLPHYFIGSGNQYGATYSYGMCYWEEQLWIRTKSVSCQEFFHGMQEIIVRDTPDHRHEAVRAAGHQPAVPRHDLPSSDAWGEQSCERLSGAVPASSHVHPQVLPAIRLLTGDMNASACVRADGSPKELRKYIHWGFRIAGIVCPTTCRKNPK